MNVYQLKPNGEYCGGMALVAAHYYEAALDEYLMNGIHNEELYLGEFCICEGCDKPIPGLEWHGETTIICDNMYFE